MFQIVGNLPPTILRRKSFLPSKHRNTCPEESICGHQELTLTLPPLIHLLWPHQRTLHAPRVQGIFNPSCFRSCCSFNQRCSACHLLPTDIPSSSWALGCLSSKTWLLPLPSPSLSLSGILLSAYFIFSLTTDDYLPACLSN